MAKTYNATFYAMVNMTVGETFYVGFTTKDTDKVREKLMFNTNANIHNYIITHPDIKFDFKLIELEKVEDKTITFLNMRKKQLKKEYNIEDVVRPRFEDDDVKVIDIDINNPECYVPIDNDADRGVVKKSDGTFTDGAKYSKLPMKCDICSSIFNRATKSRHEKTQKHQLALIKWQVDNANCPFCGEHKCQTHKNTKFKFSTDGEGMKILFDKDGNKL